MELSNAPRRDLTISGVVLSVPAPFAEGHVLRPNEASVLNQTYAENVRNNFASAVKDAVEKAGGLANLDRDQLQSALDEYLGEYDFGVRGTRTTRVPVDPVDREAMRIAKEKVRAALAKAGYKVARGDEEPGGNIISKEKLEELAEAAIAKYPEIVEAARTIVAAKTEAGKSILEGVAL